jgi:hypothetical protein
MAPAKLPMLSGRHHRLCQIGAEGLTTASGLPLALGHLDAA